MDVGEGSSVRFYDLSVPLRNFAMEQQQQEIKYFDHREFARAMGQIWGVQPARHPLPGVHQSFEYVTLSSHAGTHVDAPSHYGPNSTGKIGRTIDEVPLEWCYGPGVWLDFGHQPPSVAIEVADVKAELERIRYTLKPLDIVMIRT